MCFSLEASFAASAVLAATGVVTLKKSTSATRMYAAIPFLFAIQQFFEGLQWHALAHGTGSLFYAYGFLFFAYILWPVYIPLGVLRMETDVKRIMHLRIFSLIGAVVSGVLLYTLTSRPFDIIVLQHHISYENTVPFRVVLGVLYVLATSGACLLSSHKWVRVFGITTFIAALATALVVFHAFTSVWCFFSAILSILIYIHISSFSPNKNPRSTRK